MAGDEPPRASPEANADCAPAPRRHRDSANAEQLSRRRALASRPRKGQRQASEAPRRGGA
jgi:hypothetical protein